ncbi:MAG: hypothetical protein ACR2KV_13405 [Solirubrobacteraceae bacterium]
MLLDRLLPIALTALAAAPASAPAAAHKAPANLVTVIGTRDVRLDAANPTAAQRIPIRLGNGVRPSRLVVTTLLARIGANRNAHLTTRFIVNLDPRNAPVAIALTTVTARRRTRPLVPGTYRIVLGFRDGSRRQRLPLSVFVPAVDLRADPPFKVDHRVGLRLLVVTLDDRTSPHPRLNLSPGSTSLTGVTVTTATQPSDGRIGFNPAGASAGRLIQGGTVELEPVVDDVPPGTYRGVVEVRADQLTNPIDFPYEVVVKRSGLWIILVLAGGFLVGLFVRKGLVSVIGRLEAIRAGNDYAAELDSAATAAADAQFRERVATTRDTLLGAIRGYPRPATVATAVNAARNSWKSAVQAYEARHGEQAARAEKLAARLPDETGIDTIDEAIAHARIHVENAVRALAASDPGGAAINLDLATTDLNVSVPERAVDWAGEASALLDAIAMIPAVDRLSLDAVVAEARTNIARVTTPPGLATAGVLAAAHTAVRLVGHAVQAVRQDINTITPRALELIASSSLEPKGRTDPARLGRTLAAADDVLVASEVARLGGPARMAVALAELRSELRAQILSWSPRADAAAVYDAGDVLSALKPDYAELGDHQPDGAEAAAVVLDRGSPPPVSPRRHRQPPAPATGAAPHIPDIRVAVGSSLNLVGLIVANGVRIVLLTAIFSSIGWLAYHEHFMGTTQEMLGIFLWAFTTDLTIEGVTRMASQRATGPPGAA